MKVESWTLVTDIQKASQESRYPGRIWEVLEVMEARRFEELGAEGGVLKSIELRVSSPVLYPLRYPKQVH